MLLWLHCSHLRSGSGWRKYKKAGVCSSSHEDVRWSACLSLSAAPSRTWDRDRFVLRGRCSLHGKWRVHHLALKGRVCVGSAPSRGMPFCSLQPPSLTASRFLSSVFWASSARYGPFSSIRPFPSLGPLNSQCRPDEPPHNALVRACWPGVRNTYSQL